LDELADILSRTTSILDYAIPHDRGDLVAKLHADANVLSLDYQDAHIAVTAAVPQRMLATFEAFLTP